MRMGMGLHLEQLQKLIMTPELRQAIVILQLSTLELTQYLQQQLLENPVLEMREEPNGTEGAEQKEEPENLDVDWEEYFQDGTDAGFIHSHREIAKEYSLESYVYENMTLQDHLLFQLKMSLPPGQKYDIGEYLIGNIDDSGYLRVTVAETVQYFQLPESLVIEVLQAIQSFDPPGVGSRDLAECLLIQLSQSSTASHNAAEIVKYYLKELGGGRLAKIARRMGISIQEAQQAADLIKTLDPKPGHRVGVQNDARYIVPDVVVERIGKDYVVLVNDTAAPRLGINPMYKALLRRDAICDAEARKFIENKLNAAAWVIKCIEQRRATLYRVVNTIIDFQRDFLVKGVKALRPLTLRQVAEVLGMHESTVSRAAANKYIQTPQGVFELKFFFASGVNNSSGSTTSSECIKKMVQELVQEENPLKPYADQQIANLLKRQGIQISRRTIAKYRGEMGTLPAAKRRRY